MLKRVQTVAAIVARGQQVVADLEAAAKAAEAETFRLEAEITAKRAVQEAAYAEHQRATRIAAKLTELLA